jgi:alpha-glucoside transport system permease protein
MANVYLSLFGRNGPPTVALTMLFTAPREYFAALSTQFVGLNNYVAVFTDRLMLGALRNNILFWIGVATPLTVIAGLLIAVLADRRSERVAKSVIFCRTATRGGRHLNFMYRQCARRPRSDCSRVAVALGGGRGWTTRRQPVEQLFWSSSSSGFRRACQLFSAAIKGIPDEILEAARVDGATEIQLFFGIMIPHLMGTIIAVTTTIIIFTLKVFDVVWVMTGGQFGTDVIATQFYRQSFINRNSGFGSAIAIVLLIAIVPVMVYNLRRIRDEEAFR